MSETLEALPISRPVLFETDGFRDLATLEQGPGQMNPETIYTLTSLHVQQMIKEGRKPLIVIARDPRPSGELLEQATVAGAVRAGDELGVEVLRLGVAPTPVALWAAQEYQAGAGGVITASHNPPEYNGLKLTVGPDKPNPEQAEGLSKRYWDAIDAGMTAPDTKTMEDLANRVEVNTEVVEKYKQALIRRIQETCDKEQPLKGKLFVYDGANGAASDIMPDILERLGATVEKFACDLSKPINEKCGAADLEGVKAFLRSRPDIVQNKDFVGAISNDGDGDRIKCVGAKMLENGELDFNELDGNHILEMLAPGQTGVVGTVYTNQGTIDRLEQKHKVDFTSCPNGDTSVTKALKEEKLQIGSEPSGHVIIRDWLSSGDGLLVGALIASISSVNGRTFYQEAAARPLWPERMIKLKLGRYNTAEMERDDVAAVIQEAEAALGKTGRVVVRPSGTEKGIYRVWAAGKNQEEVDRLAEKIALVMAFPATFAKNHYPIAIEDLDKDGQDALRTIRKLGYTASTGLLQEDLRDVAIIADQDDVYKYCRRDSEERFGGVKTPQKERVAMAQEWHKKMRLALQLRRDPVKWYEKVPLLTPILRKLGKTSLAGHVWTGPEKDGTITFAIRMNKQDSGKGIGTLATRLGVSLTKARMPTKNDIHLETWGSNHAKIIYAKAGAVPAGEPVPSRRPAGRDETSDGDDGNVADLREFWVFQQPV